MLVLERRTPNPTLPATRVHYGTASAPLRFARDCKQPHGDHFQPNKRLHLHFCGHGLQHRRRGKSILDPVSTPSDRPRSFPPPFSPIFRPGLMCRRARMWPSAASLSTGSFPRKLPCALSDRR